MSRRTAYATCTLCEATCGLELEAEDAISVQAKKRVVDVLGFIADSIS